ncbi:MAG: hypothetical protein ACT4QC_13530 [Planctomycetaceae bacterium]
MIAALAIYGVFRDSRLGYLIPATIVFPVVVLSWWRAFHWPAPLP